MFFGSFLVSVTEVCSVNCRHCGFRGTSRDREPTTSELYCWIEQVCSYGVPRVIFTGGEPFQRFPSLLAGFRAVQSSNRAVATSVFTSSFWAVTEPVAFQHLEQLPGLHQLYLSSDIYHQERVPAAQVINVIRAAQRLGIPNVSICITIAEAWEEEHIKNLYSEYASFLKFHVDRVISSPFLVKIAPSDRPLLPRPSEFKPSCYLDTPLINPNGDVSACHAGKAGALWTLKDTPYFLGNLHDDSLADILNRAECNPEYQYLRCFGPRGIALAIANSAELRDSLRDKSFSSGCDLCFKTIAFPDGREAFRRYVAQDEQRSLVRTARIIRFGEQPGYEA